MENSYSRIEIEKLNFAQYTLSSAFIDLSCQCPKVLKNLRAKHIAVMLHLVTDENAKNKSDDNLVIFKK